jgi:hypothetical protein
MMMLEKSDRNEDGWRAEYLRLRREALEELDRDREEILGLMDQADALPEPERSRALAAGRRALDETGELEENLLRSYRTMEVLWQLLRPDIRGAGGDDGPGGESATK